MEMVHKHWDGLSREVVGSSSLERSREWDVALGAMV